MQCSVIQRYIRPTASYCNIMSCNPMCVMTCVWTCHDMTVSTFVSIYQWLWHIELHFSWFFFVAFTVSDSWQLLGRQFRLSFEPRLQYQWPPRRGWPQKANHTTWNKEMKPIVTDHWWMMFAFFPKWFLDWQRIQNSLLWCVLLEGKEGWSGTSTRA